MGDTNYKCVRCDKNKMTAQQLADHRKVHELKNEDKGKKVFYPSKSLKKNKDISKHDVGQMVVSSAKSAATKDPAVKVEGQKVDSEKISRSSG